MGLHFYSDFKESKIWFSDAILEAADLRSKPVDKISWEGWEISEPTDHIEAWNHWIETISEKRLPENPNWCHHDLYFLPIFSAAVKLKKVTATDYKFDLRETRGCGRWRNSDERRKFAKHWKHFLLCDNLKTRWGQIWRVCFERGFWLTQGGATFGKWVSAKHWTCRGEWCSWWIGRILRDEPTRAFHMCCSLIWFLKVKEKFLPEGSNKQAKGMHFYAFLVNLQESRIPLCFLPCWTTTWDELKQIHHFAEALRCVGLPGSQQQECEDLVLRTLLVVGMSLGIAIYLTPHLCLIFSFYWLQTA